MSTLTTKQISDAIALQRYAALARLGGDPATLGTFDPALIRDARLLVPMDVRGLFVATAGAIQAVPTETVLPIATAGDVMPVPPQPFGPPVNRAIGVHLHWAMPDGLTRGDAGAASATAVPAGNPTSLPALPDRWVVVRMNHRTSTLKAWVIESDRGDHHDLPGWREPGAPAAGTTTGAGGRRVFASSALNAAAGGDLAWAATYDAVIDRFAFHDDLADVPPAQRQGLVVSYLIAGWWSDVTLDPLYNCGTVAAYHSRTKALGWLAPEPAGLFEWNQRMTLQAQQRKTFQTTSPVDTRQVQADALLMPNSLAASDRESGASLMQQGPPMPSVTLLHGTLTGLTLDGGPDLAPAATQIEVAVGPSGFGALSAMLADGSDDARIASERLLAAFASGLLATIDQPNGLVTVDEDRHGSGFIGWSGPDRDKPDRVAEGDIMSLAPTTNTTGGAGKTPPNPKKVAGLEVRLTKKSKHDVVKSANEQRAQQDGPAKVPRTYRDVAVPGPRSFTPADLAFVVRGAERSLRHGGDGRFTPDGRLACRLSSHVVTGYQGLLDGRDLPSALQSLGSGAVPPEIDLLLREAVLTDPYRWQEISAWATRARGLPAPAVQNRVKAELALRAVAVPTRGADADIGDEAADPLRKASLLEGQDPSPIGVTRWAQPWVPLWCDWELALSVDDSLERWTLGDVDLELKDKAEADATSSRTVQGRTLLASAPSRAIAGKIRQWLSDEDARDKAGLGQLADVDEAQLAAAANAADGLDVLLGTFAGLRETLLGLDPVDASRARIDTSGAPQTKPTAKDLPTLLAGGGAKITRLRIVDSFGRSLDLPAASLAKTEVATTMTHPAGTPNLLLRPRFQRPTRLAFRLIDPDTADGADDVEAKVDQEHPDSAVSPVAGWILADHVDEGFECFDSAGNSLGQLLHDELTGGVIWEGAPGRLGPIGGPPDPGDDPGARHVTRFAAGLVAADAAARRAPGGPPNESALSALLRGIDTTLWTVDPLGSLGTAAVAGLVGRPIAVVRALIRLDVLDDLDTLTYQPDPDRAGRQRRYAELALHEIHVRIGTLTRTDDTVLAYAVDDDYSQLRLVAPEVRTDALASGRLTGQLGGYGAASAAPPPTQPIAHPYLSGPTDVTLRPGQLVRLTIFMHPGGKVHATTGLLPRKALALARDWFSSALTRISPSFRVGPVLVDPTTIRLPMVTGLGKNQTFTRRDTPQSWRDDPIAAATQTAYLPEQPSELQEGWIRVVQQEQSSTIGGATP